MARPNPAKSSSNRAELRRRINTDVPTQGVMPLSPGGLSRWGGVAGPDTPTSDFITKALISAGLAGLLDRATGKPPAMAASHVDTRELTPVSQQMIDSHLAPAPGVMDPLVDLLFKKTLTGSR